MVFAELSDFRQQLLDQPTKPSGHGHHFVQFYENPKFLADSISQFVSAGLIRGEGSIIIAKNENIGLIEQSLKNSGIDIQEFKQTKQLIILDAAMALNLFIVNGLPDRKKFNTEIGGMIETMSKSFPRIRAFGEMVGILWNNGNKEGTILLEELWNELALNYKFSLMCGYSMNSFNQSNHAEGFESICHTHSHTLPSEEFLANDNPTLHFQKVALLEQQAKALNGELQKRHKVEAELREAIKTRDDLISMCSHELKTPLTSLSLQTVMSKRKIADGDRSIFAPEGVSKIVLSYEKQINRLIRLVDEMLDLTRITSGKLKINLESVNLSSLIYEVLERFSDQLNASGCEVTIKAAPGIIGNWDKFRLEQVIVNLLTNAIKYGKSKPIEITTTKSANGSAILTIRDHGIGIAKGHQERIFQRFERIDPAKEISGLGLGLYIVKQILNAHAGKISIESEPNTGSAFIVELPL
ncbi:MAG TPA: ATP-binding protein [Bacteriovoracaceae bacterium]|nr:ATP-binding protein [Bacteriovoracaceae bacterium]